MNLKNAQFVVTLPIRFIEYFWLFWTSIGSFQNNILKVESCCRKTKPGFDIGMSELSNYTRTTRPPQPIICYEVDDTFQ